MKSTLRILIAVAVVFFFLTYDKLNAQVLISSGAGTPDPSAMLEIRSTTQGILIPRLTTAQRNTLSLTAVDGLLVYDSEVEAFYLRANSAWVNLSSSAEIWSQSGSNVFLSNSNLNVGVGTSTPGGKFVIKADGSKADDDALFEIQNSDGQPVFVVTSVGARLYIDGITKGASGGFAVGRYGIAKGYPENTYFMVSPDSTRVFTDEAAGASGGFAVGRYGIAKDVEGYTFFTAKDSTRVYTDQSGKGASGGFAVGRYGIAKGVKDNYMFMVPDNYFIGHQAGEWIQLHPSVTGIYNTFFGYQSGLVDSSGSNNVFIGYQTGYKNLDGNYNIFMGNQAGYNNLGSNLDDMAGSRNVFLGFQAGYSNTIGYQNVFIGDSSGRANSQGVQNVFVGIQAGRSNTFGTHNVFMGFKSGYSNTTASGNIAIGTNAGKDNRTGGSNILLGNDVASNNNFGNWNVLIGNRTANGPDFAGSTNVMIGNDVGGSTTSGSNNVFLGDLVGTANSTGSNNIFIGASSGKSNTTANNNIFIGTNSGFMTSDGQNNLFAGNNSGYRNTHGNYNVFMGNDAGMFNTEGIANVFIGESAGEANTTGNQNVFLGNLAGFSFQNGNNNVFLGNEVAKFRSNGMHNVIIGNQAGYSPGIGDFNVFLGNLSGFSNNGGDRNVFIGHASGYANTSGERNIAIGDSAFAKNQTGQVNTILGFEAGYSSVSAHNNTYVGAGSGKMNVAGSNTFIGNSAGAMNINGTNNVALGLLSGTFSTGSNNVFLGDHAGSGTFSGPQGPGSGNVFIGYQAGMNEYGNNKLYIENSNSATPLIWGDFALNTVQINSILNINGQYTLPTDNGDNGQVLTTNGTNTASWLTIAGTGGLITADNGINFESLVAELGGTLNETTTITQGNYGMIYDLTGTGDFEVRDGGATNFYINEAGNIGIGTSGSSLAKVRVLSNSTTSYPQLEIVESAADDQSRLMFSNSAEGSNWWILGARSDNTTTDGYFTINYSPVGDILSANGSGNVGIGVNPSTSGKLVVNANSTTTYPQLELRESAANNGARLLFTNTGEALGHNWTLYGRADDTDASSSFNIYYSPIGNVISINGSGNVSLIGDQSIGGNNTLNGTYYRITNNPGTGATPTNYVYQGNTSSTGKEYAYSIYDALWVTSHAWIDGTLYNAKSFQKADNEYFKDAELLSFDRGSLTKIQTYKYSTIDDVFDENSGTITKVKSFDIGIEPKSLQSIFPELVESDNNGSLYINYSKLSVILLETYNQQEIELENLRNNMGNQDREIENLKKQIEELKTLINNK